MIIWALIIAYMICRPYRYWYAGCAPMTVHSGKRTAAIDGSGQQINTTPQLPDMSST